MKHDDEPLNVVEIYDILVEAGLIGLDVTIVAGWDAAMQDAAIDWATSLLLGDEEKCPVFLAAFRTSGQQS